MDMLLPLALLGLGLVLVIAEVVFPSMGMLSIFAAVCIIGSVVLAFGIDSSTGTSFLVATAILVPVMMFVGVKLLPKSPVAKYLMAEGFTFEEGSVADERDADLLGQEGEVLSPLRPAGTARLEGRRVDVVSRGELIDAGTHVRVIELKGNRVVVAKIDDPRDETTE